MSTFGGGGHLSFLHAHVLGPCCRVEWDKVGPGRNLYVFPIVEKESQFSQNLLGTVQWRKTNLNLNIKKY